MMKALRKAFTKSERKVKTSSVPSKAGEAGIGANSQDFQFREGQASAIRNSTQSAITAIQSSASTTTPDDADFIPRVIRSDSVLSAFDSNVTQTSTREEPATEGWTDNSAADATVKPEEEPNIVRARSELMEAVDKFKEHYEEFAKENRRFVRIENDVHVAIGNAAADKNINRLAKLFGAQISTALLIRDRVRESSTSRWTGKLSDFLTKFYPIARFSLRLTSSISEAISLTLHVQIIGGKFHAIERRGGWTGYHFAGGTTPHCSKILDSGRPSGSSRRVLSSITTNRISVGQACREP